MNLRDILATAFEEQRIVEEQAIGATLAKILLMESEFDETANKEKLKILKDEHALRLVMKIFRKYLGKDRLEHFMPFIRDLDGLLAKYAGTSEDSDTGEEGGEPESPDDSQMESASPKPYKSNDAETSSIISSIVAKSPFKTISPEIAKLTKVRDLSQFAAMRNIKISSTVNGYDLSLEKGSERSALSSTSFEGARRFVSALAGTSTEAEFIEKLKDFRQTVATQLRKAAQLKSVSFTDQYLYIKAETDRDTDVLAGILDNCFGNASIVQQSDGTSVVQSWYLS